LADIDGVTPGAVEEIVRMSSPVMHFRRTVTTDGVVLGDHEFSAGDKVVLWYNSANRDEVVFDDPDRFDVTRDPNPHVGFGGPGPHFCLGAHLARREIAVLYRHLLARFPDVHATAEPDRLRANFVNGVKHLQCAFSVD
jgi:cytochrome P450